MNLFWGFRIQKTLRPSIDKLCQDCNIWIDKPGCYQLQCLVVNDIDGMMITIHQHHHRSADRTLLFLAQKCNDYKIMSDLKYVI